MRNLVIEEILEYCSQGIDMPYTLEKLNSMSNKELLDIVLDFAYNEGLYS